jgi:hypothetical protein
MKIEFTKEERHQMYEEAKMLYLDDVERRKNGFPATFY